MPTSEALSVEELLAAADTLTEADAVEEYGDPTVSDVAPANVTEFIHGIDASEIAATAAKLSEALGGPPVSDSAEPIKLAEPAAEAMQVVHYGEMDIITTGDRIDVVRALVGQEAPKAPFVPAPRNEQINAQIAAEQAAGRQALARQQDRANYYKDKPTPRTQAEIDRAKGSVEVMRPTTLEHLHQQVMRRTPVEGKGEGY